MTIGVVILATANEFSRDFGNFKLI